MAIGDEIAGLIRNENTIETLRIIKQRYGEMGLDGISFQWVTDSYMEAIEILKTANEVDVLSKSPLYKLRAIINNIQAIHAGALIIMNYTYPNPNPQPTQSNQGVNKQQKAAYLSIINSTVQLQNFVYDLRVNERMLEISGSNEQAKDLTELIKAYNSALDKIMGIEESHGLADATAKRITQIRESVSAMEDSIRNYLQNLTNNTDKTNSSLKEIVRIETQVKESNQEVENKKVQIVAFAENIDENKKQIQKLSETANDFFSSTTKRFDDAQESMGKRTDEIIKKNEEYQGIINILLKGANAGSLNQTFELKATGIEKYQWVWLLGIISCIALVLGLSLYEFDHMAKFTIWEKLAERGVLIVPVILLDIFLVFQYNKRQKLIDEYRFKSAMALSLWSFHDLVEKNKEGDVSKAFVIDSIKRIFESPFQDSSNLDKGQRELLLKVIQGIGGKIDKAGDDWIKKTIG